MSELLQKGIDLVVYGMGTVFLFLTLLVLATVLMSKVVSYFEPKAPPPEAPVIPPGTLAAIAAAVRQYRSSR